VPRRMVLVTEDGASPVLDEVAAHDELQLQSRLARNPDLIPIEEFGWGGPLLVVGRETTLPSGSVDLIGVARSGEVLVAEFNTGPQNPDSRHALAQALDYGSDLGDVPGRVRRNGGNSLLRQQSLPVDLANEAVQVAR
jgi:hypothetical protein